MAIVQNPIIQVENTSFPDGRYVIKNRAANLFWNAGTSPIQKLYFWSTTIPAAEAKDPAYNFVQVNKHSPTIQVFKR
jgi:hypothetical protein